METYTIPFEGLTYTKFILLDERSYYKLNFFCFNLYEEKDGFKIFLGSTTSFRFLDVSGWKLESRSFNTPWITSTSLTTTTSCDAISPLFDNPLEGWLLSMKLDTTRSNSDLRPRSSSDKAFSPSYQWEQWRPKPRELLTPTDPLWADAHFDDRHKKLVPVWRNSIKSVFFCRNFLHR